MQNKYLIWDYIWCYSKPKFESHTTYFFFYPFYSQFLKNLFLRIISKYSFSLHGSHFILDSQEESDEISDEFEFAHHFSDDLVPNTNSTLEMSPENAGNDESLQNFQNIMEQFKKSNKSEKYSILGTMWEALKQDPKFQEEFYQDAKKRFQAFKVST